MGVKVLVSGANGFVGSNLCEQLEKNGHQVVRAVRQSGTANAMAVGELSAETNWTHALQGVDVVVHTAARVHVLYETVRDPVSEFRAVNVHATERLARQAVEAGVKRLVFISTIGVLGNHSANPFVEGGAPNPSNAYSASKWEAEECLRSISQETGLEVVILRPPLVYGPGVKANFYRLMHCVAQGQRLPFGMVCNARDFVSVCNLSSVIMQCLDAEAARNETYLVADGEAISTPNLIRKLAHYLDMPPRLIPVPPPILKLGAILLRKERLYNSVCCSLRIDISKLQRELNWRPVETLDEGLEKTVAWYQAHQAEQHSDEQQQMVAA